MDAINGTPVKRRPLQDYYAWRADNIRPYNGFMQFHRKLRTAKGGPYSSYVSKSFQQEQPARQGECA